MSSVCIMQGSTLWSMESESKTLSEVYSQALENTKSEEVLSLEDLIVNSDALQYQYCNTDEMEKLVTTRRAIRKAVIDLRDGINEARKNGQYQNLDSYPKQIATKLTTKTELFTKALQAFCADINQDAILTRISMVFKQLSLILNNETKNIDNIGEQLNDNYRLDYLFRKILSEENYKASGDMSSDVLNWLIGYWLESKQSPNEFFKTIIPQETSEMTSTKNKEVSYVSTNTNDFIIEECFSKNNSLIKLIEQLEIGTNDGEKISELNKAISYAINEVKDKHLLETLDVLMSLIIKASKNITIKIEAPEEGDNTANNGNEDEKEQNSNNEEENDDKNSNGEENKEEIEELEEEQQKENDNSGEE